MNMKKMHLFFLPCLLGIILMVSCAPSEDRGPVTEPEYPAEENLPAPADLPPARPDSPSEEDAPLPEQPESETADIEPPSYD